MSKARALFLLAPAVLLTALSIAGCAERDPANEAADDADTTEAVQTADGHGGPGFFLRRALFGLELSPDQSETVDRALSGVEGRARPPMPALDRLIEGVRQGRIDHVAVEAARASAVENQVQRRTLMAKAVQTIHDTLSADQRTLLVTRVQARMDARMAEHRAHHPEGFDPLARLTGDLQLTDAQTQALDGALGSQADRDAERAAFHDRMRDALQTFAGDGFDASAVLAGMQGPREAHLDRMASAVETLTPILDAGQREKLAVALERWQAGRFGDHAARDDSAASDRAEAE